jgi:hypothetical protein
MSIDARVRNVIRNRDGSGSLCLVDRPATRPGDTPGIAGQSRLHFAVSPADVGKLTGRNVWGSAGSLMLGETQIAERDGYTGIRFTVESIEAVLPKAVA